MEWLGSFAPYLTLAFGLALYVASGSIERSAQDEKGRRDADFTSAIASFMLMTAAFMVALTWAPR